MHQLWKLRQDVFDAEIVKFPNSLWSTTLPPGKSTT